MQSLRTKKHTYTHTNNFSFTWRLKSFEMHFSVLLLLSFSPSSYHKQKPTRHICNWQTHAADIVFHSFTVQRRYLVLYSLIHPLIHPSIHISMYPATTTPLHTTTTTARTLRTTHWVTKMSRKSPVRAKQKVCRVFNSRGETYYTYYNGCISLSFWANFL